MSTDDGQLLSTAPSVAEASARRGTRAAGAAYAHTRAEERHSKAMVKWQGPYECMGLADGDPDKVLVRLVGQDDVVRVSWRRVYRIAGPDMAITQAVQDSARFNGFELVTELLSGKAVHACRMIGVLEQEGENPLGLLTVLVRDLHLIVELKTALPGGENPAGFLKKRGVFQPKRSSAVQQAARRLSLAQLHQAINLCSLIDRAAKGFDDLSPWHHLRDLSLILAGKRAS